MRHQSNSGFLRLLPKTILTALWQPASIQGRAQSRFILAGILTITLAATTTACGWATALRSRAPSQDAVDHETNALIPGASSTPLSDPMTTSTPPPKPTPVDPWEDFAAPAEPSAIEIRRPMHVSSDADQLINIIVLGSDQRPNDYGHRTDVMLLVSINPDTQMVKLLSFPRDLYVYIPGWRVDRINVADAKGGPEMVADTIRYNFGLQIDHWVRVDFSGFTRIVNALGGIDVQVGGRLQDECGRVWSYSPGVYHMDGFQALCYARMRKTTGDFDRLRREQELALALFDKVLSINGLKQIPELYRQYRGFVETNLDLADVISLVPAAVHVAGDPSAIQRYDIGPEMGSLWRVPVSGASVILPEWDPIEAMLEDAFGLSVQS